MYLFGLSHMFTEAHIDWNGGYNMAFFEEQIQKLGAVEERYDVNRHIAVVMEAVRHFINGRIAKHRSSHG